MIQACEAAYLSVCVFTLAKAATMQRFQLCH